MTPRNTRLDVFIGMMLLLAGHVIMFCVLGLLLLLPVQFPASSMFQLLFMGALFGISLTQLIYVIPLCLRLRRRGQFATMKGVIIGAIITALLNGSCFLWAFLVVSTMHHY